MTHVTNIENACERIQRRAPPGSLEWPRAEKAGLSGGSGAQRALDAGTLRGGCGLFAELQIADTPGPPPLAASRRLSHQQANSGALDSSSQARSLLEWNILLIQLGARSRDGPAAARPGFFLETEMLSWT